MQGEFYGFSVDPLEGDRVWYAAKPTPDPKTNPNPGPHPSTNTNTHAQAHSHPNTASLANSTPNTAKHNPNAHQVHGARPRDQHGPAAALRARSYGQAPHQPSAGVPTGSG